MTLGGTVFKLSGRSFGRLRGVHPLLVACVCLAIKKSEADFLVDKNAVRAVELQAQFVADGVSNTMRSKHLPQKEDGYSHAVDLYPCGRYKGDWESVHRAMLDAADELGVNIVWGGDWKSLVDKPHYELGGI